MREKKVKSEPSYMHRDCEEVSQQFGSMDEASSVPLRRNSELTTHRKAKTLSNQYSMKRLLDFW